MTRPNLPGIKRRLFGRAAPAPADVIGIPEVVAEAPKKYSADDLQALSFATLRELAGTMGIKGRGKEELVREILEAQA
jgi:hypothetical protein